MERPILSGIITLAIAVGLLIWGNNLLKKGNMFWGVFLIALGVTSIGGIGFYVSK